MTTQNLTLVTDAIHRPDEPRHFMRFKPVANHIQITSHGKELAATSRAMRLNEVARDIYDSVVYVPQEDCSDLLRPVPDKSTHCPLKGDASYFALEDGQPIAWTYDRPIAIAESLRGYVAFYGDKVTIIETGPASTAA